MPKALKMCCARGLKGQGFSAMNGLIQAVDIFILGDVKEFLIRYPDMCPEFTKMFRAIEIMFSDRISHASFTGDWDENIEEPVRRINNYFTRTNIFVYGTLMKGQSNHSYLLNSDYTGEGIVNNCKMYDIGHFPGIVNGSGSVTGEVYSVINSGINDLDRLEGEGNLYIRKPVTVTMKNGKKINALAYIYMQNVRC